jgi:hypothetical protein
MFSLNVAALYSTVKVQFSQKAVGTAFSLRIKNENFLVTARHQAKNVFSGSKIAILNKDGKVFYDVVAIAHCENDSDVSVLELDLSFYLQGNAFQLGKIYYGEEIRFCGFPLGLAPTADMENFEKFYLPLMKGGIFSGMIERSFNGLSDRQRHPQLLFDAINNHGFSGSPIFVKRNKNDVACGEANVIGVVSEYLFDNVPIGGGKVTRVNSGFMVGIPIGNAVACAEKIIGARPV